MAVIGIDFGTTNSLTAIVDEFGRTKSLPNAEGEEITLSVIGFENKENPIVGREAANEALAQPADTIFDFKLKLGTNDVLYTSSSGKQFTATDCAALILSKLKADAEQVLGEEIESTVISVPANFKDNEKNALLDAAEMVNLKVSGLIHEPTAAALAYGLEKGQDQTIMVSDLGGGTYDVSVVRCQKGQIEVLGTDGIKKLGGRDFTQTIAEFTQEEFVRETGCQPDAARDLAFFQDLRDRAEQAKYSLGVKEKTKITLAAGGQYHTVDLTRAEFNKMVAQFNRQITEKCDELLHQCSLQWKKIDRLLLVGGGNKVLSVQEAMEECYGRPVSQDIDPLKAISYGAAIQAAIEASNDRGVVIYKGRAIPAPKIAVQDITAYGIGCAVDDPNLDEVCAVIIPKHTQIPCEHEDLFRLKFPDQTAANVQVLQGNEGQPARQCLTLGQLVLEELTADPTLPKRIRVLYQIDKNGMCTSHIEDLISGKKTEMQFDYSKGVSRAAAS